MSGSGRARDVRAGLRGACRCRGIGREEERGRLMDKALIQSVHVSPTRATIQYFVGQLQPSQPKDWSVAGMALRSCLCQSPCGGMVVVWVFVALHRSIILQMKGNRQSVTTLAGTAPTPITRQAHSRIITGRDILLRCRGSLALGPPGPEPVSDPPPSWSPSGVFSLLACGRPSFDIYHAAACPLCGPADAGSW
ncbi:unnamed protein product [Lota lota]